MTGSDVHSTCVTMNGTDFFGQIVKLKVKLNHDHSDLFIHEGVWSMTTTSFPVWGGRKQEEANPISEYDHSTLHFEVKAYMSK